MQTRSRSLARSLPLQCSEWSECSLVRESAMGIGTAERGGTGGGRRRQGGGRKEGDEKGDGGNGTERRSSFAINTFHVQLQSQSRAPFVPFRSIPVQALKASPESIDGVEAELAGWLAGLDWHDGCVLLTAPSCFSLSLSLSRPYFTGGNVRDATGEPGEYGQGSEQRDVEKGRGFYLTSSGAFIPSLSSARFSFISPLLTY